MASTFDRVLAAQQPSTESIASIYDAYKSRKMSPEQASEFESDVNAGHIMLPRGAQLNQTQLYTSAASQDVSMPGADAHPNAVELPQAVTEAYVSGKLSEQQRNDLESDIRAGLVKLPPSAATQDAQKNLVQGDATRATQQDILARPEPTFAENAVGAITAPLRHPIATADASLSTVSNAVLGTVGMVGGSVHAIAKSILDGTYGSSSEQDIANQQQTVANDIKAVSSIGWQPHSELAQTYTDNIGEVLGAAAPLAPAAGELSAISQSSRLASPMVNAVVDRSMAPVRNAAQPILNNVKQRFAKAEIPADAPATEPIQPQTAAQDATAPPPTAEAPAVNANDLAADARSAALGGFGSKKATENLAGQVKPDENIVAAAERQGVEDSLDPDHYSTNQAYRQLSQFLKSQPGSEAAAAEREGLGRVAQKANDVIEKIGGTDDISSLSDSVGKTLEKANEDLKNRAKYLYETVEDHVGLRSPVETENILNFIKDKAADIGGEENLSAAEKLLIKKLTSTENYKPTYALLDQVRQDIGAAKRGKQNIFGTSNSVELANLESALRADQKIAATRAGAGDIWEEAQATSKMYKGIQEDLTSIFGKQLDKSLAPLLERSIPRLKAGDTAPFIKLIKHIPEDLRQKVVASGIKSFFQETNRGSAMNFNDYARWFEHLEKQKKAYTAIMSNLPRETVSALKDFATMAKGIASAQREFLVTGKAVNKNIFDQANNIIGRIYEQVQTNGVPGAVGEIIGTTHGMPGAFTAVMSAATKNKPPIIAAADRLITSKEFVDAVKASSIKSPAAKKAAVKSLMKSKKLNDLFALIKRKTPNIDKEAWITNLLKLGSQSESSQEKNHHDNR